MSSTLKPLYGAKTALTVTNDALAAAAARQSAAVDNTTNLFEDALVSPVIVTGTAGGTVSVYAYGSNGAGTPVYTDGASGADAAYTMVVPTNLVLVKVLNVPAASTTYGDLGPFPIAQAFGGILPDHWGLVFVNGTAAALGTGCSCSYQGYNGQIV